MSILNCLKQRQVTDGWLWHFKQITLPLKLLNELFEPDVANCFVERVVMVVSVRNGSAIVSCVPGWT